MAEYRLTYDEWVYVSREADSWSRDSTDGSVSVEALYRRDEGFSVGRCEAITPSSVVYDCEDVPVDDDAYVVVVEYITGDTFGYNFAWCIAGLYATYEGAVECARKCREEAGIGAPWVGYFERLADARVETLRVQA